MKIILHEKIHDLKNQIISIILFVSFFSVIYVILNLMVNINNISNSEWFDDMQMIVSEQNSFIKEQVKVLGICINTYGTVALCIIAIMLVVIIKKYIDKSEDKRKIMYMIGYNKAQILIYYIKGFIVDMIITILASCGITSLFIEYIYNVSGMAELEDKSGIILGGYYMIWAGIFVIVAIYTILKYRKSIVASC